MKRLVLISAIFFITIFGAFAQHKSDTAFIIVDIQNNYFEKGSMPLVNPIEASLNARKLLDKFRSEGKMVIHVQHLSKKAMEKYPDVAFGSRIHENVKPMGSENIVIKHFPNAFKETTLLDDLKKNDIKHVVICGMMTHMCVDATVRAAKDFGFDVTVISDACATRDLDFNGYQIKAADVHNAYLAAFAYAYAGVKTTAQYLGGK